MSFERIEPHVFVVSCEDCSTTEEIDGCDTFVEVKQALEALGWRSVVADDEWSDLCPACVEKLE